jgi:hypothetical protein
MGPYGGPPSPELASTLAGPVREHSISFPKPQTSVAHEYQIISFQAGDRDRIDQEAPGSGGIQQHETRLPHQPAQYRL